MYIIHRAPRGRVVLHKSDCPLLDGQYDDGGVRHKAVRFCDALDRAEDCARAQGVRCQVCGWCRPGGSG